MTFIRDLPNNLVSGASLNPAARTATASGTGVDLIEGDGLCFAVVYSGTTTDGTHTYSVEESSDNSTFSAVTPIDSLTAVTSATTAGNLQVVKFQRTLRYCRVKVTVTGSPGTGSVSGAWIGQQKKSV
jgi:hypothetical protein